MKKVVKQSTYWSDNSITETFPAEQEMRPGLIRNVPAGYSIYQLGEDIQLYGKLRDEASDGCPGIYVTPAWDSPDTWFTEGWQLFMYAANLGMTRNNVTTLMGTTAFMMNGTGVGKAGDPRRNYITLEDLDAPLLPRMDKYRLMIRNNYALKVHDSSTFSIWHMDGNREPLMKAGKRPPSHVDDIESGRVSIMDYVYNPFEHFHAWHVCNNLKRKNGQINDSTISPFAHGIIYPWTPDPSQMYTFFPNVSTKQTILISTKLVNKVVGDTYANPYRREV